MGLKSYLLKRTLYSFLLLFFVLVLNFAIFELMPGDPMALFANQARLLGQARLMLVTGRVVELSGLIVVADGLHLPLGGGLHD